MKGLTYEGLLATIKDSKSVNREKENSVIIGYGENNILCVQLSDFVAILNNAMDALTAHEVLHKLGIVSAEMPDHRDENHPREQGMRAFIDGVKREDCPYTNGTEEQSEWENGWDDSYEDAYNAYTDTNS